MLPIPTFKLSHHHTPQTGINKCTEYHKYVIFNGIKVIGYCGVYSIFNVHGFFPKTSFINANTQWLWDKTTISPLVVFGARIPLGLLSHIVILSHNHELLIQNAAFFLITAPIHIRDPNPIFNVYE